MMPPVLPPVSQPPLLAYALPYSTRHCRPPSPPHRAFVTTLFFFCFAVMLSPMTLSAQRCACSGARQKSAGKMRRRRSGKRRVESAAQCSARVMRESAEVKSAALRHYSSTSADIALLLTRANRQTAVAQTRAHTRRGARRYARDTAIMARGEHARETREPRRLSLSHYFAVRRRYA